MGKILVTFFRCTYLWALKYRRPNEAEPDKEYTIVFNLVRSCLFLVFLLQYTRMDKIFSILLENSWAGTESWADIAAAVSLEPNQLLSCYCFGVSHGPMVSAHPISVLGF